NNNFDWYVRSTAFTGTLNWSIGDSVTFKSITAYRELDEDVPVDVDGTPYEFQENIERPFSYHQFSQEFQVLGTSFDDRLSWIGGLYYLTERARKGVYSIARKAISPNASLQDSFAHNRNYAVFGQ